MNPTVAIEGHPVRLRMTMRYVPYYMTETHWYVTDNDIAGALVEAGTLLAARGALLGIDTRMTQCILSADNTYRDSLAADVTIANTPGVAAGPTDPATSNLLTRMESGPLARRSMYLSLVPDVMIQTGKYNPNGNPNWDAALKNYLSYLAPPPGNAAAKWGFLARNESDVTNPKVVIGGAATDNTGGLCTYTTLTPSGAKVGDAILVTQCNDTDGKVPQIMGMFACTFANDTEVSVTGEFPISQNWLLQSGRLQRLTLKFVPYTAAIVRGIGGRKRGVRTTQPLGKRHFPRPQVS